MNLAKETLNCMSMRSIGKAEVDFCVFINRGVPLICSLKEFLIYAEELYSDYDDGYGRAEVPDKTAIIFKNKTWLSRYEYDGSEGWQYNVCPSIKDYI